MTLHSKLKSAALGFTGAGLCIAASLSHANLDVSQLPLMLVDSVAPNLIFSIDDSGSMKRAHVPDSISPDSIMRTRRAKSAHFNPNYYNPDTTYVIPKGVNVDGSDRLYSTSFTSAHHMGFKPGFGNVNLATSYRATWYCTKDNVGTCAYGVNGFGSIKELADNPTQDFRVQATVTTSVPTATVTSPGGIQFNITRTTSGSLCTATASWNGVNFSNVPCSRGSNSSTATVDLTRQAVPAYYYVFNPNAKPNCDARTDDDCYSLRLITADTAERQNFAIWYSFYRDRALATQSAAMLAFYELPSAMRVTWQSINNCRGFDAAAGCGDNRFRLLSTRHKSNFLAWLTEVNFTGGTPLRATLDRAGKFLQTDTAWAKDPNPYTANGATGTTVQNPVYACRPSFHILMTDGMWNATTGGSPTGPLRFDHSNFTVPTGQSYVNTRRPYADATTDTLADLAMHYWATDLNPSLSNDIKPYIRHKNANATTEFWDPRNNPATWQSMTNYMVGLGLSEALNNPNVPWNGNTFEAGYLNILNGTADWPPAGVGSDNNVYDLWHAAVNSRGEFFSAESPDDIVKAFKEIINRIAERTSTAGKPGVSSSVSLQGDDLSTVSITNRIFETRYDSEEGWAGNLVRKNVVRQANGIPNITEEWSAATRLDAQTTRNILMAGSGDNGLQEFNWNNLSSAQKATFNVNPDGIGTVTDSRGSDRVNYVRGSRNFEGNGPGNFRARKTVLGDIINSSPVVVSRPDNVPYLMDRIDGAPGRYLSYMKAAAARPELVYVGANDGMLHAFKAGPAADGGGTEAFAFIPSAVIPNLYRLAGQSFAGGGHRFYVDGTPVVRDVYLGGEWRTVLVGTLRAGGKSIFALDITNPGADGSGVKLLWEVSNASAGFEDLGYTFPRPEIARLHSGQWGVLLGNGYDSKDGKAALFVIDIADGTLLRKLEVDDGASGSNGLSSVRGADNNSDGVVDYAYAGDLKGNLWRFDLAPGANPAEADPFARSVIGVASPNGFKVSYGGKPMFQAAFNGVAQPITGLPSIVRHPTRRGYLIIVGTGKYFETSDSAPDTSKPNTLYAVWDRYTRGQGTTAANALANRSNMEQRTITNQTTASFDGTSRTVRVISDGTVQWYMANTTPTQEADESRVNRRGWYLDLSVGTTYRGEMLINDMLARGGTLLFSTITPNDDPCADGLTSFLYGINAETGARLALPPFDFSRDGQITTADLLASGIAPSGVEMAVPGGIPLTADGIICGNDGECIDFVVPTEEQGRTSWQDVPRPEDEGEAEEEEDDEDADETP